MKLLKTNLTKKTFSELRNVISMLSNKSNLGTMNFDSAQNFQSQECSYNELNVSTSKLENGITVVTENTSIPSRVHMGILLNVGTRDESKKTSGALHSIQTTQYKSFANTNETINYGMVQMSGGDYRMEFDRESIWFMASCLPHDAVDLFNMVTDTALEPRNFNSTGVAIEKLPHSMKTKLISGQWNEFSDLVFHSVFGKEGLGNELWGNPSNYKHLDSLTMQEFQLDHISPEKIVVVGIGVQNHGEFHELVEAKLHNLFYNQNCVERKTSKFQENDVRIPQGKGKSDVALIFESGNLKSKDLLYNYLLSSLLGKVEVNQFDKLNVCTGRLQKNIYDNQKYVLSLEAQNYHYSDAGMFMLRGGVSGNNVNNLIENLSKEVKSIDKLDQVDFDRAKKRLGLQVLQNLSNPKCKVAEYLKQQSLLEQVKGDQILREIESLNLKDLQKFTKTLFSGKMCFIATSPEVEQIHSYEKIKKMFA